ncbi:tetratricopeptide repeat protein [Saprospiraceae bacterium]|nr:tetratricopeptide repeat protein [Saprospiraceae bacterium]
MASKKNKKKQLKAEKKAAQKIQGHKTQLANKKLDKKKYGIAFLIILITALTFSSSLNNKFVNWDDDKNFLENDLVSTINENNFWSNTAEIFKSDVIGGYNPLTIFSFAIEKRVFGFNKSFYWHLDNLILHLLGTFFVFLIGYRLKLGYLGAAILALLFGIHPMRVESVAWVTERKDVLFGLFYLISIYYYIKGKQDGFKTRWILIIAISFILSLLSKIQAVLLPITLIFIDYYLSKDAKLTFKSIISKWPFYIGSLIIGITNIMFLAKQGSIVQQEYQGISRLFIGSYQLAIYYIKSIVPFRLSPLYPYPSSLPWYMYASLASFNATAVLLWVSYKKKWKVVFFGIGIFISNVILLLQIVGAGQGFLADRFTYIAYFGLFFIMAYYINLLYKNKPKLNKAIAFFLVLVFSIYGYTSYTQNKIWKNSDTLWTHVLKYYNKTTLPFGNRANYRRDYSQELLNQANRIQNSNPTKAQQYRTLSNNYVSLALADYNSVINLKNDEAKPYNSLARLYFNFTERDSLIKALENYNKAIQLDPKNVEYRVNKGATYAKMGDMNNALSELNEAEKIDPTWSNIYLNRSVIYNTTGNHRPALADIDKYLSYNPDKSSDMWYEKGRLNSILNQQDLAIQALTRAISMQNKGIYFFERAKAYYKSNNITAAKADVAKAQQAGYNVSQDLINNLNNLQ